MAEPLAPHRRWFGYAAWLDRHRLAIWALSFVVAGLGFWLAARLPLRSDISSLLPPGERSVRDLEVLKGRARVFGTVFVDVGADDPALRARAAAQVEAGLRAIEPELVGRVSVDDHALSRYIYQHRYLFIDKADLVAARDTLAARIAEAKLAANPLFVDLDDDDDDLAPPSTAAPPDKLAELEAQLAKAKAAAEAEPARVSADGRLQLFMITAAFPTSDIPRGSRLLAAVRDVVRAAQREFGPAVRYHLTGTVTMTHYEHASLVRGMGLAIAITVALCAIALLWYYRSVLAVGAVMWALTVGVAITFAITYAAVGQLNMMSAFLTSIVVGNGINPALILLARYFEEVRGGQAPQAAVAPALAGAARGTLAATLTAAVAYASLLVTDFRGFMHFGVIAGVGMLACWFTAYTLLPSLLFVLARRGLVRPRREPALGRWLARLVPRRLGPLLVGGALVMVAGLVVAIGYIAGDPFAKNWRALQSDGPEVLQVRADDQRLKANFDPKLFMGSVYQVVFAARDQADASVVANAARAADRTRPEAERMFLDVLAFDDLIPDDQEAKRSVLAEIRALMADEGFAELPEAERKRLDAVRPPASVEIVAPADVPPELAFFFTEKDGSQGKLVVARGAGWLDTWDVDDRVAFADAVRAIDVPTTTAVGGEALIVADVIRTMMRDTPIMIAVAVLGAMLAVGLIVRRRRHVVITVIAASGGIITMIAACALLGIQVHFLDVIALPITIGIGIDYAVNLVARDIEEGGRMSARQLVSGTGGAVVMCSYTTLVGYGSLLLSTNGGIRTFGLAAVIGEITCMVFGVIMVPAMLEAWRRRAPGAVLG